jgi:hypothetical protein
MPHYFLFHEPAFFQDEIVALFAESWQTRSMQPVARLAEKLRPAIASYADRYQLQTSDSILTLTANRIAFQRHTWEAALGEALYFAALELPDAPFHFEALR